jgi:pimeloyl-ACP methyl ester carboxylesterase
MEHPIRELQIPHKHAIAGEGDTVYINWLCPPSASASNPVPCILILTGLDGYRTELAVWQRGFLDKGVATCICEIPGTGDSPAIRDDPTSPDRQYSTLLDFITSQKEIDPKKILAWGFSTGGYYSLRMGHTHKDQLLAAISFGGGAHHMFDPEWLSHASKLEYPFDLAGSLAYKFGYGDDLEKFKKEAHKFSLVHDGTLHKPCTKVFLVNGDHDEIFPIDDMFVALSHGGPKLARIVNGKKHMGEPDSFFIILKWIWGLLGLEGESAALMRTIPFQAKY